MLIQSCLPYLSRVYGCIGQSVPPKISPKLAEPPRYSGRKLRSSSHSERRKTRRRRFAGMRAKGMRRWFMPSPSRQRASFLAWLRPQRQQGDDVAGRVAPESDCSSVRCRRQQQTARSEMTAKEATETIKNPKAGGAADPLPRWPTSGGSCSRTEPHSLHGRSPGKARSR